MPIESGIEAAYRAELDAAPDRDALRAEIQARMNAIRSPFNTAAAFGVEEVIGPRHPPASLRVGESGRAAALARTGRLGLPG